MRNRIYEAQNAGIVPAMPIYGLFETHEDVCGSWPDALIRQFLNLFYHGVAH